MVAVNRRPPRRANVTRTRSFPAPIGGWNARDAIADMDPKDALVLDNWFPLAAEVMTRKGYTQYATGLGTQVETILSYSAPSGSEKMFAAAGSNIYEITNGGAVGAAAVTGLTSARWEYVNITVAGGSYLYAVNASDTGRLYDGSSWSTPSLTGISSDTIAFVALHKRRLWFVKEGTLQAWYLPVDVVAGTVAQFDLQTIARRGGYLMAMGTWTLDAGYGVDDHAVFITSEGEVAVYRGTDPDDAATWALVGVWEMGAPIGRRCFRKYGGDLLVICQDGVLPLSKALISSRVTQRTALTDKIMQAMSDAAVAYNGNFGWQLLHYPRANMLLLNVPVSAGSQVQFAMNTITGSWCRFTGIYANCWELFQDEPYFGGDGFVGRFWNTFYDVTSTSIQADAQGAFNYLGDRGSNKRVSMVRPILSSDGSPTLTMALRMDYDQELQPTASLSVTPLTGGGAWDSGVWDSSLWGGDLTVLRAWQSQFGVGRCVSPVLRSVSGGIETRWQAIEYVFEPGGMI